jgi:putative ABC transport system permease protein
MQFSEVLIMALAAIRANKLRSILTLLGIVVGVFSIIAVMTALQVLQNSIESGLSQLGAHTFQIQKMPVMSGREKWLKALKRKDITQMQAQRLKERMILAGLFSVEAWGDVQTVQSGSIKTNPNVGVVGEEPIGVAANNWIVKEGRSLSENDIQNSAYVHTAAPSAVLRESAITGIRSSEYLNRKEMPWEETAIILSSFH